MEQGDFLASPWTQSSPPPDGWESLFAIYAGTANGVPPMLGTYTTAAGALVFHPRYPLVPGLAYRAVLRPASGPPVEKVFHALAAPSHVPAAITQIYPSADTLPENVLKLYIEFSAPMSRGYAWQHIHLLDANGLPVDLPFLEVEQELWDPGFRRMTVLFDPGRIKRGLVPNRDAGPPIEEGKRYTLVIDREWPDATGDLLSKEARKTFLVGPAVRKGIDLKQWRIGARQSLTVEFPEPLDFALLSHALQVTGPDGRIIEGTAVIDRGETRWSFTPAESWKLDEYRLQVDTALEDLAGNRIGRAFDVDVFDQGSERITRKTVQLPFRIGSQ
jgi:hypothetical protein